MTILTIDWRLLTNNEEVINDQNKIVEYANDIIKYTDEYGIHEVDICNKIYIKKSPDNIFKIDFDNNLLTISFDSQTLKFDIQSEFNEINNGWQLCYSLGEEQQVIEIIRKEEI